MLDDVTILLTGAGAPGAPGIIKCFRKVSERKINIVGVDMNSNAAGRKLVDKFFTVPAAESSEYLDVVFDICKKEKVQVVVPIVTRELRVFSRNIEMFNNAGIAVSVMDKDNLVIVNNKIRLLEKMRELGMDTPEFIACYSLEEVKAAFRKMRYPERPLCIKAAEGNGSRGIRLIDPFKSHYDLLFKEKPTSMYMSYNDIMCALAEKDDIPAMMVMELLPGEEYGVDALCENGKIIFIAGRSNYPVNSSIPQGCIIENRDEPINIAKYLIQKLKLSGNVNFDFKYDSQGRPKLMEINPRLSATIVSYCPAGVNLPYMQIKRLLKEETPNMAVIEGTRMQRRYNEVFFDNEGNEIDW